MRLFGLLLREIMTFLCQNDHNEKISHHVSKRNRKIESDLDHEMKKFLKYEFKS